MLMKPMCSYPWVRETYGADLPDVPWIQRPRTAAAHAALQDQPVPLAGTGA